MYCCHWEHYGMHGSSLVNTHAVDLADFSILCNLIGWPVHNYANLVRQWILNQMHALLLGHHAVIVLPIT